MLAQMLHANVIAYRLCTLGLHGNVADTLVDIEALLLKVLRQRDFDALARQHAIVCRERPDSQEFPHEHFR